MTNKDAGKNNWIKHLWRSGGIAMLILFGSYFLANVSVAFSFKEKKYRLFERLVCDRRFSEHVLDSVTFVDVTYDKMLVDETERYGDGICKVPITDRGRLLEFLKMMEGKDYKHLILDLLFEKADSSAFDAELSAQMLKMRDVIICKRMDETGVVARMINDSLESIARFCDFFEMKGSGGVQKYKFLQNGENSVALELYEKETGRGIKKLGPFYFDGWRPCHNAEVMLIHKGFDEILDEGQAKYNLMGSELLCDSCFSRSSFEESRISGKDIFVGVLEGNEDRHSTYMDLQPGGYLHFLAYKSLKEEKHIIHWWYWIPLLIVYTGIGLWILNFREKKPVKIQRFLERFPIIQFLYSFVGYGLVLFVISFLLFWVCDMPYDPLVPSLAFAIISNWVKYNRISKIQ
jgi:hypothetical protein